VSSTVRLLQPITPTSLAAKLGLAPTTLSAAIRRLERRGLLRRAPNPDDGRSYLLELTAKGDDEVARAFPAFAAARELLTAELDQPWMDTARQLGELEDAVRAALAKTTIS
jgi:DNA-binding MarR family transcriptional regulator